jgi:putative cell wall-binding protein
MKMKSFIFYVFLSAVGIGLLLFPNVSHAVSDYYRVAGESRIETAIEISKTGWESSQTVILARADHPADALAAASLSGAYEAPILLTYTNSLPNSVIQELNRLQVSKIYVLGGIMAISNNVANELTELGFSVERINGQTRFATAVNINKEAGTDQGTKAIVVNGYTVADALSASSTSAIDGTPIYLATKTSLPVELPSNITEVTIYGGEAVIGPEVHDQLVKKGIKVTRVAGYSRYDTNIAALDPERGENIILVRGTSVSSIKEDYPDAVAASGLAKILNANIVLTHPTRMIPEVEEHFAYNRYINIVVLGGEMAVSSDVVYETTAFIDTEIRFKSAETIIDSVIHPGKDILYYTSDKDNGVWYLNYETSEADSITFTERPESLYYANGNIYVALLKGEHNDGWWTEDQKGAIAIIDAETFTLKKKFDINLDPFDLVVDNQGYIYISSGSGQWTDIKSYDSETGAEVSSMSLVRQRSYIELDPNQDKIYTINTDVSPRDISMFTISSGEFTSVKDSPYHGDYDLGSFSNITKIKVSPDANYVFNSSGNVFHGTSLNHYQQLLYDYDDVIFDLKNNSFITGRNGMLLAYDYNTFEIFGANSTYGDIQNVHHNQNAIVMITTVYLPSGIEPTTMVEVIRKNTPDTNASALSENKPTKLEKK